MDRGQGDSHTLAMCSKCCSNKRKERLLWSLRLHLGEGGEHGQSHRYLKGAVLLSSLSKESKEEFFQCSKNVWGLLTGVESLDCE